MHGDDHDGFGYCTNFMISGTQIPFEKVRTDLAAMGQSAVIVGDERYVKVHIHTDDPGSTLSYAVRWGDLSQVKIDNMNAQAAAFTEADESVPPLPRKDRAIVAVASGDGIAQAFTSLGVDYVLRGGSSMNPSIEEMLRGVAGANADWVVLLPNNGNVLMAAQKVPDLATVQVTVIPTRSVVQGLAAISVWNESLSKDQNVERMTRAVGRSITVEIARAERDTVVDGTDVVRGQFIGLVNDRLTHAEANLESLTIETLSSVVTADHELMTVFSGTDVAPDLAELIREQISAAFPELEIDLVDGGQPHYLFVISVE
jgi:DAK2 domain fusion protein YloV